MTAKQSEDQLEPLKNNQFGESRNNMSSSRLVHLMFNATNRTSDFMLLK